MRVVGVHINYAPVVYLLLCLTASFGCFYRSLCLQITISYISLWLFFCDFFSTLSNLTFIVFLSLPLPLPLALPLPQSYRFFFRFFYCLINENCMTLIRKIWGTSNRSRILYSTEWWTEVNIIYFAHRSSCNIFQKTVVKCDGQLSLSGCTKRWFQRIDRSYRNWEQFIKKYLAIFKHEL